MERRRPPWGWKGVEELAVGRRGMGGEAWGWSFLQVRQIKNSFSEWRSGVKDAGAAGTLAAPTNARSGLAASVTAADRVSGHKTQLYLVAASTGGPASGSRCGFCDTTYNCSCVWNPDASFMTDRNERSVICARGLWSNWCVALASGELG